VYVLEPSEGETLQILQGLAERYERHHHCCYDDEALEAAVKLSHTYIADRFLPDKVSVELGVCVGGEASLKGGVQGRLERT
jgi:ATP-dependent Clp protease ATP-binding subunit ClpA